MTFFSFIALALGMAAATADRAPRQAVALIAVARGSRRATVCVEARPAVRASFPPARHPRVRAGHRPLRRLTAPLRGAAAPRAPGA